MTVLREINAGSTEHAVPALRSLRPNLEPGTLINTIDGQLRPAGYRLVGVFNGEHDDLPASAIAGFRATYALVRGLHLVVDEMATLPAHQGRGYAGQLVDWLKAEGRRLGCGELHLDSAVGDDRAAAHRLYHRHHLKISAHHFHCNL